MDDEASFGPVFHRLTSPRPSSTTCSPTTRSWSSASTTPPTGPGPSAASSSRATARRSPTRARSPGQIGLAKAMRKYDLRRVITFHSRVRPPREFSAELPDVIAWMPPRQRPSGQLWSRARLGRDADRPARPPLLRFRQPRRRRARPAEQRPMPRRRVDVPTLDGVAFIDPRRSDVDIVQAVGRAIRKAPDKKRGHHRPARLHRPDEDPERGARPVGVQARLGRAQGPARPRRGARRGTRRASPQPGVSGRPPRMPGRSSSTSRAAVGVEFADAFNTRLVEQTTASWEFWFGLLERYAEREGHALIPQAHKEEGLPLGSWVSNQRAKYARGDLDGEHARRLEEVRGWVWDTKDAAWEQNYAVLLRHVECGGHARIPQGRRESDVRLGEWVANQRADYRRGELARTCPTARRASRLGLERHRCGAR